MRLKRVKDKRRDPKSTQLNFLVEQFICSVWPLPLLMINRFNIEATRYREFI